MRWFAHLAFIVGTLVPLGISIFLWFQVQPEPKLNLDGASCDLWRCTSNYCYSNSSVPYQNNVLPPCRVINRACALTQNYTVPGVNLCFPLNGTTGNTCIAALGGKSGVQFCTDKMVPMHKGIFVGFMITLMASVICFSTYVTCLLVVPVSSGMLMAEGGYSNI